MAEGKAGRNFDRLMILTKMFESFIATNRLSYEGRTVPSVTLDIHDNELKYQHR